MAQKTNYTSEGQDRLLQSLKEREDVLALSAAYLDRCQEFEDAAYPIIEQRNIDDAVGHRLDRIGQLVHVERGGRTDDAYRLRIRAEFAILRSDGLVDNLINITRLLLGMATADVQVDQQYPKSIFIRPRNTTVTQADADVVADQLRRAVSAATYLQFIYTTLEDDDNNLFRFAPSGASEASKDYGFGNGTLAGAT